MAYRKKVKQDHRHTEDQILTPRMLSSLIWLVDLIEIFAQEYRLMSKFDFQSLHVAVLMNSTMCFNMLQIVENNSQLVTTCEWERVFPCFRLIILNCHKLSHGEIIQSKVFGSLKFSYVMMVKSLIAGLYKSYLYNNLYYTFSGPQFLPGWWTLRLS